MHSVLLNGVAYRWPRQPVVVVCVDGGDPAYLGQGVRDGIIPNIERFMREGFSAIADGTVPSFTHPNNMSLITGSPPSVHGISGNFCLNDAGQAVAMTGPELLRSKTILAVFADAGAKVVSITTKDKRRTQLGNDLDLTRGNIGFSSEFADRCTLVEHDLSNLSDARLRSHGSTTEARVPFFLSRPASADFQQRAAQGLKSHQIFDYAINGMAS